MENGKQLSPTHKTIVGIQFLFVAFGATVLVPLLVGLAPSTALFTAGVGTLIFHLVTKGMVPIFLGSSFAFIAPIIKATELYGMAGTLSGLVAVGLVYFLMSALVKWQGVKVIERLFPPVVIGLSLAGTGVNMAQEDWLLAIIALVTAIIVSMFAKGLLQLIPIFSGIIVGYVAAILMGKVDFSGIAAAPWIGLPEFVKPEFSWGAILFMIPVAIAPIIEHVGDVYAVSQVADKDFVRKPGLHRTMLGDGLACCVSGFIGGPPVTTYSEVTGAMILTKVTDPSVIRIAAVTGIIFSLVGKVSAFLKSIPGPVLGGIMLLLFGMIAATGVNNMIRNKTDMSNIRNLIIVSLTLTTGIGGAVLQVGNISMTGIGLSALIGVFLNLVLPKTKEKNEINGIGE